MVEVDIDADRLRLKKLNISHPYKKLLSVDEIRLAPK